MFASFDGPKAPIRMTFYSCSGFTAGDVVDMWLKRNPFDDLEIHLTYASSIDMEHRGEYKFGKRKPFGQLKLF